MKVFVSGCFDMLHSGHVAFLEEAATYGDLYVGIGSDKTVAGLKNRKTVNSEAERLYMVKALRCVKEAWVNSGSGVMDFEPEVRRLKPEIFFVNTDGLSAAKERFCQELGIRLVVSQRVPSAGLPSRSTTALRQECRIPYRLELGGGWLDQPAVNNLCPGPVVVMSIEPTIEFNDRTGMATSSRRKAIELWQTQLPSGDRIQLARTLFCVENPPGTAAVSGSQDQLGILLPGVNKLNYGGGYWPVSIESDTRDETLDFIAAHLQLIAMPPRADGFDVFAQSNINAASAGRLAAATEGIWQAIQSRDVSAWGAASVAALSAQLEMFPAMLTADVTAAIERYRPLAAGWKMTGCGGGGYLLLISHKPVPNAIRIQPCRKE